MIRGRVVRHEPRVPITIHGSRARRIQAILDTGFTGHLCLAARYRGSMILEESGRGEVELADGRCIWLPTYLGEVTFDGERRQILVTVTDAEDSLVGTALLRRKRVRIDFARRTMRVEDA